MMRLSARLKNELHRHILGPGEHFGTGGHLRVAYRRIGSQCEHLDYAKTSKSTGYPRQAKLLSRAIVFRFYQRKRAPLLMPSNTIFKIRTS